MHRRPNTQTVQWFLEMEGTGQLDLNPPYQRRSVWNDDYRRFYIDTILRNYPSPSIYLDAETRAGMPTVYHVIDGKQRLETLIAFTRDQFHLGRYFQAEGYPDAYYSELSEDLRDQFIDYVLSVENISRSTDAEIKSAFERLNRNTAKLNRQELRKAQYEGEFISRMNSLAAHPFWETIGVANRTRISRMLDVEYVSEIFLLTMHGVQDGSPNKLDDYYAQYDDEIPDEAATTSHFFAILDWFSKVDLSGTRFTNLGDFYSLWGAVMSELEKNSVLDPAQARARLQEFSDAVATPSTDDERAYSDAVRQGTNKESSRQIRVDVLGRKISQE